MIYQRARERLNDAVSVSLAGANVCLYANDANPKRESTPLDFEEAKGYRPHALLASYWIWGMNGGAYPPIVMDMGEAQTLYGFFIRAIDGQLIMAERFDKPMSVNIGDEVTINLKAEVLINGRN